MSVFCTLQAQQVCSTPSRGKQAELPHSIEIGSKPWH